MKQSFFASSKPVASLCLSGIALVVLSACGGGSSGSAPVPVVATGTCMDGNINNTVGADDPFYVNSWHLKNTGPTQVVSARNNYGVAGIDANVENVHQAGKGCTGKGVTIAIVDTGMEIGHEDLKDNVLPVKSFNFLDNTSNPSPVANQLKLDHGTGVAGIAGARGWNGMGSRGIAPFASLVAFPIVELPRVNGNKVVYPDSATTDDETTYLAFGAKTLADAQHSVRIAFGTRADDTGIFNYSAGASYAAPIPVVSNVFAAMELAAKDGTTKLRGGLGAIYFQAAGNDFEWISTGYLPDNSAIAVNCSAELTKDGSLLGGDLSNLAGMSCGNSNHEADGRPYFYVVAAIHNKGKATSYSSAGAANWITGFGGEYGEDEAAIITTDNSGCTSGANNIAIKAVLEAKLSLDELIKMVADLFGAAGSKDLSCSYTGTMNGTSAATPSVSGVAALMLEANPKLTWQDVGYILAKTARKVDETIASGTNAVTFNPIGATGPWNVEESWIKNAAGFNFQNRYGFGLVDANAAVKLAANYTAPAGRRAVPLTITGPKSTSQVLTSNAVGFNSSTVQFTDQTAITGALRLDLQITNNTGKDINPGFLQFEIINTATGTKSIVLPAFSSWYVGGKTNPIKAAGQLALRFHTNAFYGEAVKGTYTVAVIDFSGSSGAAGKTLDFTPTLTSYSM